MEPQVDDVFKLPSVPGTGGFLRRVGFFSWGALSLHEADRRLGLTERVARISHEGVPSGPMIGYNSVS